GPRLPARPGDAEAGLSADRQPPRPEEGRRRGAGRPGRLGGVLPDRPDQGGQAEEGRGRADGRGDAEGDLQTPGRLPPGGGDLGREGPRPARAARRDHGRHRRDPGLASRRRDPTWGPWLPCPFSTCRPSPKAATSPNRWPRPWTWPATPSAGATGGSGWP